jgi:hypothetical protein
VKSLASLSLILRLSEATSISLNGSNTRTDYADSALAANANGTFAENYEVRDATLGFDATGIRTTLGTSVGYTELRFQGESHSGLLANVALSRKVGTRSTFSAEVGTQYADTAQTFAQGQVFSGPGGTSDATASNDPFKSDYLNFRWTLVGARNTMTLGTFIRKESHERETDLDRKVGTLFVDVSRRLSPQVTLSLTGRYIRDRFNNSTDLTTTGNVGNVDLDSWSAGAGLEWLVGRSLGFQFRFDHQDGSGTGPTRNYTENRAYAGLVYSSGPRGR